MTRLLVLRPEPGASATVEAARKRGLDAVALPLFEIETLDWRAPDADRFDGLLLTSANAIRFGGRGLESLRSLGVYAVGNATAKAARDAGFVVLATGDSGVDELLGSIPSALRLLHLCGEQRRDTRSASQAITPVPVYRSRQIDIAQLDEQEGVALIHSPRAGRRFAELAGERDSISIVAISEAAASAVGTGWKSIDVADRATDDALLALAASLCNKPDPE